jgi:hypothetical protein
MLDFTEKRAITKRKCAVRHNILVETYNPLRSSRPVRDKILVEKRILHHSACRQVRNRKRHFVPDGTKAGKISNVSTNILFLTEQPVQ